MGRKRKHIRPTGSLVKNIALFLVSISILAGASLLFHNIIQWPDLPIKDMISRQAVEVANLDTAPKRHTLDKNSENGTSHAKVGERGPDNRQQETASINEYRYTFYDILYHQKQNTSSEENHYCIQIAAFKSSKMAQEYKKKLKRTNRLECRVVKKKELTVVLWGSFPTKTAAERYNKQLCRVLEQECMVVEM
jgi:hypothetical protein